MEYEKVIDKIKKLQALVERGIEGEAKAAKRALDLLCEQYDIKIEDLFKEEVQNWSFKIPYHDPLSQTILFQIYAKVTQNSTIAYGYNVNKNIFYFDLTNSQYIEMSSMVEFFFAQWKKEKKQLLEDLVSAFINKHDLFSGQSSEEDLKPMTDEEWQSLLRKTALMQQLEDVSYLKRLG